MLQHQQQQTFCLAEGGAAADGGADGAKKEKKKSKKKEKKEKKGWNWISFETESNLKIESRLQYCCAENLPLFMLFFRHSNWKIKH